MLKKNRNKKIKEYFHAKEIFSTLFNEILPIIIDFQKLIIPLFIFNKTINSRYVFSIYC